MFVVMNRLPFEKRRQIIHQMVEGGSVRGIARLVDVSPVTVLRYLELAGRACAVYHAENVRNVAAKRIQCDETWSFVFAKDRNASAEMKAAGTAGSVWTWVALDTESKLIVSYLVGGRDAECARDFMHDVASRLANRVQLTTDGHGAYLQAVDSAFGGDVDFAQLVKLYGNAPDRGPERKYSPGVCIGARKHTVTGKPQHRHVSTSYVEKQNQTMRQHMKRFARLTAAHSKKLENHIHMISLYTVWYNYARINAAVRMSPAMAAGLTGNLWDITDIVRLIEAMEAE
jgi:IS1 family transposase